MTEDLRAQLRAELNNERPPPLGDVVGAALREGRRVQRRRRRALSVTAGSVGVLAVVLAGGVAANSEPRRSMQAADAVVLASPSVTAVPVRPDSAARKTTPSPGSVPTGRTAPTVVAPGRTLAIHSGVERAAGAREKATTGAMLHLLTQLLPAGRTSNAAVSDTGDPYVQIYLDRGDGPGMVRLIVGQLPADGARPPRGGTATVSIEHVPDNCLQQTVAVSRWPDGTAVQLDVASCLAGDGRSNPPGRVALSADEAVRIVADPRWGVTMDGDLVKTGEARYGKVPVFAS